MTLVIKENEHLQKMKMKGFSHLKKGNHERWQQALMRIEKWTLPDYNWDNKQKL